MRILHAIPYYNYFSGGDVRVCFELSKNQSENGHDVTILSLKHKLDDIIVNNSIKCGVNVIAIDGIENFNSLLFNDKLYIWLNNNITNYDIVHLHTFRSIMNIDIYKACINNHVPYVLQAHGSLTTFYKKKYQKKVYDIIWGNDIIKNASGFVALNEKEKTDYLNFFAQNNDVIIISNGIELKNYINVTSGNVRIKYQINSNSKIILYIGRLTEDKGIKLLLEGFKLYLYNTIQKDCILILAGVDSGYKRHIEKFIKNNNISENIKILNYITEEEKIQLFFESDIFITPRYSGMPITFLEACATGTPIITTNKGEYLEWIDNNVGLVVDYSSVKLSLAISKLLDDEFLYNHMVDNCYKQAKLFSYYSINKKMEDFYSTTITRFNP